MSGLYNDNNPKTTLFNIGFAIGLSTFLFPSVAFVILIVAGLGSNPPFQAGRVANCIVRHHHPYYFILSMIFLTGSFKTIIFPGW